jgi:hypothetical protein
MGGLLARDNHVQYWRRLFRDCFAVRAEIALRAGNAVAAMPLANRALDVARSTSSVDKVADRFAMARAWRLIGDSRKGLGDAAGARAARQSAVTGVACGAPERPQELIERLRLLQRLGRKAEAGELAARLSALGYRGFT